MATKQERQQALLTSRREKIFASLQRSYDAFKALQVSDVSRHRSRFDKLDQLEADFEAVQNEILVLNSQLEQGVDALNVDKVQASFESIIYAARSQYLDILDRIPAPTPEPVITSPVATQLNTLPTIKLPVFSGDMAQWPDFYALFDSLVHKNNAINNVQRFHYLRSSLRDAALSTINSFQISSDNYSLAYSALVARYQNKRLLASLYIQQVLDFTPLKSTNHAKLQQFLQVHRNSVDALKALNIPDLADFLLLSLTLANLDAQTRKSFEVKHSSLDHTPSYKQLITFLEETSRTLELCCLDQPSASPDKTRSATKKVSSLLVANSHSQKSNERKPSSGSPSQLRCDPRCPICESAHSIYKCPTFLQQSVPEKYDTLRRLRRCFNCMGFHSSSECKSKKGCRTCCSTQHHSLLHPVPLDTSTGMSTANTPGNIPVDISTQPSSSIVARTLSCHLDKIPTAQPVALLGTVRALILDAAGQHQSFRAVIDSGSQVSAVTHSLALSLGLKISPSPMQLCGIGQATTKVHGNVQCDIASRLNPKHHLRVQALVLSAISDLLPSNSVSTEIFERYRGLSLADDRFHLPDRIDFLIGADLYPDIICRNGDVLIGGCPSALNTIFGWVILGSIPTSGPESHNPCSLFVCSTPSLDQSLRAFWETEEVSRPPQKDPEELMCEDHFVASHSRHVSGRYSVALPFKPRCLPLGSNRQVAYSSYLNLERRLRRTPDHEAAYHAFMREYADLQHMQPAVAASEYIIPHHCVHKSTSSSTKLRVVFNASAPDPHGSSLNQQLMVGPKLQKDLPSILTRFRTHPVAVCADIRQMYRQILIKPEDRAHQHILWRPSPDSRVLEYELKTVTYGLVPSAFQAQRVLHQLVQDDGAPFPLASLALDLDTYIDDIVSGAKDLSQARTLKEELQTLLRKGGFELHKWASNCPEALATLPEDRLEVPLVFSSEQQGIKILGLMWDPCTDDFSFRAEPFDGPLTKRSALSYIARIFDPLGLLSPFVAWMKMFIQRLWLSHLQWDEPLPDELANKWHSAVAAVPQLVEFRVPRHFSSLNGEQRIVGFCDASEKGYAAVLYLHSTTSSFTHVSLLRARSKVAPVKTLTIPKLELSSALLLARLMQATLPALNSLTVHSVSLYTDSTIVLAWLATSPHRLKTFVANRVVEVLEHTSPSQWSHVPTNENPADCASRGVTPTEMLHHPLWLSGPLFLQSPPDAWPRYTATLDDVSALPEMKVPSVLIARADVAVDPLLLHLRKFSTLLRAQRVFGHVVRFARLLLAKRSQNTYPKGPLRPEELQCSLDMFVKLSQNEFYASELRQLAQGDVVTSKLASLKPFLDSSGLLRVGGRLRHSSLPIDARHPLLLPKEAHLSSLLCDEFHKRSLHSGPRSVQALIQQQFWIVSLRGLLRQRIHRCLTCLKFRARTPQPIMSDLPQVRVQASRAFSKVGTDFAGPFRVKSSNRRNAALSKGYLCLFVCMSTKAVHLEMVSDLSTDAFLACLDRLISRRGLPSDIYSDNGRNFVGAARLLREVSEFLAQAGPSIADSLSIRSIQWHFIPPYAPHFGGLWEAGVKSAKGLMHRLISDSPYTHEEYATLFCRIEAVLNSRPLCALSADPEESSSYLSPGHFLVGSALIAPPEPIEEERSSRLSRWKRVRQLHQSFWSRWHTEYLQTLIQRKKWLRGCPNPQIGDVVFFRESTSSPLSWPIGRITDLLPGKDGIVRVVSVRTTHGTFVRPVHKLVLLPLA